MEWFGRGCAALFEHHARGRRGRLGMLVRVV
jgi:hypothetical protein